jgi:hypothetical protein
MPSIMHDGLLISSREDIFNAHVWGVWGGGGLGGEMTQALCAHMNKKKKKKE